MNCRNIPIAGMMIALMSAVSAAEEIAISPTEIRNLGITLGSPDKAHEVAAIEATGRVVIPPMGDTIVSAPQSGLLAGLNVAVGEEVVQGQVIARLQSSGFLTLQREFLDALNANLLAQNEFDRDRQLFEEGIISGRRLQETTTRARIAATSLNEHRQLLQIVGLSDAEISSLETRQKLLQMLEIRAPFDGVILDRMADIGERLGAMSPIYRLADLSSLWLEINVPQENLAAVRPGMRVGVTGSPVLLPAVVKTIGSSVDPATQAIVVRATLTEAGHGLRPGQFVSTQIVSDGADSVDGDFWVVPVAAVTRRDDNHFLFVRTEDGFDVRQVRVVGADAGRLYLDADIDADSDIAIDGVSALKALWSAQMESDS
jgi:cobalt-zinc-cadmium efflux system membrane fusion protein